MPLSLMTPIALLALLLGAGVWVGLGLMGVGIGSLELFRNLPVDKILAQTVWNGLSSPELVALPLFILMAELLFRSRFVGALFHALEPWVLNLKGGLLHTNVLGCALFALISGSSAATTSSVGKITLGELHQRGYPKGIAMGSLAGSGTLGFLIPPSVVMIIYGVLSQTSVLKLFAAGLIPGLLLAVLFMGYLAVYAWLRPFEVTATTFETGLWRERFRRIRTLVPFGLLMVTMLGSMYAGYASPSEAAALAVILTLGIMAVERSLSFKAVLDACIGTARTVSMLGLIIAAASFLATAMGYLGLPQQISQHINALALSPFQLILLLMLIYIILGCFLEGMSLIVMTLPIVLPLITAAGYDKVWFGVFLIIVVEMAQITPPVGMNLFVIRGLTNEPLSAIVKAAFPFFMIMFVFVLFLALAPGVVLWLPSHL
ncbi:TRAP transporter large permease subunit [Roseovarius sp.]|uniref:TRAP transporter large permease n=1 Tax=Roseovarius sp. TaxID=1486281 RepID=UPI000C53EA46|nr:TRAP transporter large permease subunit [Roseovarius sp.]MAO28117.1 C4-dicarboxylate ABC transporter permease [Roseovarius sp.]MAZ20997.1 C4-dicarboxylate ABC transporter permease [Roseovarius sp.]